MWMKEKENEANQSSPTRPRLAGIIFQSESGTPEDASVLARVRHGTIVKWSSLQARRWVVRWDRILDERWIEKRGVQESVTDRQSTHSAEPRGRYCASSSCLSLAPVSQWTGKRGGQESVTDRRSVHSAQPRVALQAHV
jgi:hypothetical protein